MVLPAIDTKEQPFVKERVDMDYAVYQPRYFRKVQDEKTLWAMRLPDRSRLHKIGP
jgi:hypothetical protein